MSIYTLPTSLCCLWMFRVDLGLVETDALTIAMMPTRTGSGSIGQAVMIVAKDGSRSVESALGAPDFAPLIESVLTQPFGGIGSSGESFQSLQV